MSKTSMIDLVSEDAIGNLAVTKKVAREREDKANQIKARFVAINKATGFDKDQFAKFLADLVMAAHSCPIPNNEARTQYCIEKGAEADRRKRIVSAVQLLMGEDANEYTREASWAGFINLVDAWTNADGSSSFQFDWKPFFDIIPFKTWTAKHIDNILSNQQASVPIVMKKGFACTLSLTDHKDKIETIIQRNFDNFVKFVIVKRGAKHSMVSDELWDANMKKLFARTKTGTNGYIRVFIPSDDPKYPADDIKITPNKEMQDHVCCFFDPHNLAFTKEMSASVRDDKLFIHVTSIYLNQLKFFFHNFGVEMGWNTVEEIKHFISGSGTQDQWKAATKMMTSDLQYLWARYRNGTVGAVRAKQQASDPTSAKKRNDVSFILAYQNKPTKTYNLA